MCPGARQRCVFCCMLWNSFWCQHITANVSGPWAENEFNITQALQGEGTKEISLYIHTEEGFFTWKSSKHTVVSSFTCIYLPPPHYQQINKSKDGHLLREGARSGSWDLLQDADDKTAGICNHTYPPTGVIKRVDRQNWKAKSKNYKCVIWLINE